MSRPPQLALIGSVFASGVLLASLRGGNPRVPEILVGGGALLLAAVSVHLANEYADVDTDALAHRTPFSGGSGVLPRGLASRRVALAGSVTTGLVSASTALLLGRWDVLPDSAVAILLIGLGAGLSYSVPPLELSRRGAGEVLNALLGGLLLPLYGVAVVRGTIEAADVIAFLPFTLVVFLSVMATAWTDHVADAATGKRTLQTRLPQRWLRRIYGAVIAAFVLAEIVSGLLGASPVAPISLVLLPLLILGYRRYAVDTDPRTSVAAMVLAVAVPTAALAVVGLSAR